MAEALETGVDNPADVFPEIDPLPAVSPDLLPVALLAVLFAVPYEALTEAETEAAEEAVEEVAEETAEEFLLLSWVARHAAREVNITRERGSIKALR